jgi:lipopolysaccharide/colanic/teichoic acid biosynthesis glycosyltransferase
MREIISEQENSGSWRSDSPHARMRQNPIDLERSEYATTKFVGDIIGALVLLAMTLPLILLAAILVKLTSRGPVIYSQTRLGRNGKPFFIYKIRTMTHNCESLSGPKWSVPGDNRITWIGRILRATHIDEFPQLWNVLRGEMSLVGPRPERPEFAVGLEKVLPLYGNRLLVRPGITGLAQVQLPPDTDVASVRRKLAHDLFYVRFMNPWLDLRLMVATAFAVLFIPAGTSRYLLGLPGGSPVQEAYELDAADIKIEPELELA